MHRRPGGAGPEGGIAETTERVRQLIDGIESAIAAGNDLELARYLAPPALGTLLAATAAVRTSGGAWIPARAGLRWSGCDRPAGGPGRFWLRLRFEDRTEVRSESKRMVAATMSHEVEVELDTTQVPWRLCQVEEVYTD